MSGCPECSSTDGDFGRLCANCLAKKRAVQLRQQEQIRSERRDQRLGQLSNLWQAIPKQAIPIALVLFAFYAHRTHLWGKVFGYGTVPKFDLAPGAIEALRTVKDPCFGMERCVLVYVAPWCPACHQSIDFLNDVASRVKRTGKIGMKVIIGMDTHDKNAEMSKLFTTQTFLDDDGKFRAALGVSSVPTAWVADGNGKILREIPAALGGTGTDDQIFDYYNEHYLQMTEYF